MNERSNTEPTESLCMVQVNLTCDYHEVGEQMSVEDFLKMKRERNMKKSIKDSERTRDGVREHTAGAESNGEHERGSSASPSSFKWMKSAPFWLNGELQAGARWLTLTAFVSHFSLFFLPLPRVLAAWQLKSAAQSWTEMYLLWVWNLAINLDLSRFKKKRGRCVRAKTVEVSKVECGIAVHQLKLDFLTTRYSFLW